MDVIVSAHGFRRYRLPQNIRSWDALSIMISTSMEKSIFTPQQRALQQVLRQLRLGAGLRQEDLAERLDEPQSFISKYESGERRLDFIELRHVCKATGVSLAEFVARFEEYLRACNQMTDSSDNRKSFGQISEP